LNNVLTGPVAFLTWSAIGLGYANAEACKGLQVVGAISHFQAPSRAGSVS
jgi:hypothetical protein